MKYTIRGNRSKGFTISDESANAYGRVEYHNSFSRKAVISLHTQEHYEIVPSGFWQTSFDIIKAEYKAGEIKMNWRGNMVIHLGEKSYVLKRAGFWQRTFVLKGRGEEEIASIKQGYEWTKMGYVYDITLKSESFSPELALLTLITIYCANQQYAGSGVA
jgi:hypothetical protein